MSDDDPSTFDVIIIGAGIAGLTAARELLRDGDENPLCVLVLEARNRVGGKTFGYRFESEDGRSLFIDRGGTYFGYQQREACSMIEEFGMVTKEVPHEEHGVIVQDVGGRRSTFTTIPNLPYYALLDVYQAMRRIDGMSKQLYDLENPMDHPKAKEWDSITLRTLLNRLFFTSTALDYFHAIIQSTLAAHDASVSALSTLLEIGFNHGLQVILSTKGGLQEFKLAQGAQALSQRLGDIVSSSEGSRVQLNTVVRHIEQTSEPSGSGVRVVCEDSTCYTARRCVVALSPPLCSRITFAPPVEREALHHRMFMGNVIKVQVVYGHAWWNEFGMNGVLVADWLMTVPSPLHEDPSSLHSLTCIIVDSHADEYRRAPLEHRKQKVLEQLQRSFQRDEALSDVMHYDEMDWTTEPFSLGGYNALCPPHALTAYGHLMSKPDGRLHWAGTETEWIGRGYIEGGIRSGKRVAREILEEFERVRK